MVENLKIFTASNNIEDTDQDYVDEDSDSVSFTMTIIPDKYCPKKKKISKRKKNRRRRNTMTKNKKKRSKRAKNKFKRKKRQSSRRLSTLFTQPLFQTRFPQQQQNPNKMHRWDIQSISY